MGLQTCVVLLVYLGLLLFASADERLNSWANCAKKYQVIPNHSACLQRSPMATQSGVSEENKRKIVDKHNEFRAAVQPEAVVMAKLYWDDELAMVAQRYADTCKGLVHDGKRQRSIPGRFSVGQNIGSTSEATDWEEIVRLWHDEGEDFTLGGRNDPTQVGRYVQLVSATSTRIGCGFTICGSTRSYICNYGPGGIQDISNPYESGTACSDCQGSCRNKLCDCQGKVCQNGGTMDFNSCTCTCRPPRTTYIGPNCQLNCTGQRDPPLCGRQFTRQSCDTYSNVPQDCPTMCQVCPYAGIGYDNSGKWLQPCIQLLFLSIALFIYFTL